MNPKISIITPSFNQSSFLESTIQSVLTQRYDNIEYIIIDGQSTDNSQNIIKKYQNELAYWTSEPDNGQYDAINKGFAKSTGEIMAWINSDDIYLPGILSVVSDIFSTFPQISWITTLFPLQIDEYNKIVCSHYLHGISKEGFYRGENMPIGNWFSTGYIQQESTFWRRELWEKTGGYLDTNYSLAADFDLWARFFEHADIYSLLTPLACFRTHSLQRTHQGISVYGDEAKSVLNRYGAGPGNSFIFNIFLRFVIPVFYTGTRRMLIHSYPNLKKILKKLKLLEHRNICIYNSRQKQWKIIK